MAGPVWTDDLRLSPPDDDGGSWSVLPRNVNRSLSHIDDKNYFFSKINELRHAVESCTVV